MSSSDEVPEKIRPYNSHGARMKKGSSDWEGQCLFCGSENRFFVNPKNGLHSCKKCNQEGNILSFLTDLTELKFSETTRNDWRRLSRDRGIPLGILKKAKIYYDDYLDSYCIPVYSGEFVHNIRKLKKEGLFSTSGCSTVLYNKNSLNSNSERVWITEGEWDCLALQYLFRQLKIKDSIVALPGSTNFKKDWVELLQNKEVICVFDNDKAGDSGAVIASKRLSGNVKKLSFINWPPTCKEKYDLRDFIVERDVKNNAKVVFEELKNLISNVHLRTESSADSLVLNEGKASFEIPLDLDMTFEKLTSILRKNIHINESIKNCIKIMTAVVLSTKVESDPLWMYIVGPPGIGKTLLLSSFQKSERCVFRSTLSQNTLVSGWSAGSDPSLIPKLSEKCFVMKDFTEILSMPSIVQEEILSTLRGAYDGSVEKSYGNGVRRIYNKFSNPPFLGFSMLAGVTNAIYRSRRVNLGERFLKFNLDMPSQRNIDKINKIAINQIGKEKERSEEIMWGMTSFIESVTFKSSELPEISEEHIKKLSSLVALIAYLRSEVERNFHQEVVYRPVPEAGTRLIKQLALLAKMLAVIDKESIVSNQTFKLVEKVAFDTAYGFHLDIIESIINLGGYATRKDIEAESKIPTSTLIKRLDDMQILNIIRKDKKESIGVGRPNSFYKINEYILNLWKQIRPISDRREKHKKIDFKKLWKKSLKKGLKND